METKRKRKVHTHTQKDCILYRMKSEKKRIPHQKSKEKSKTQKILQCFYD